MKINTIITSLLLLSSIACTEQKKKTESNKASEAEMMENSEMKEVLEEKIIMEKNGLKVYTAPSEKEYPKAKLNLKNPIGEKLTVGETTFDFVVTDYNLTEQTNAEKTKTLANSEKGQHIHFIVNNAPYQAKYTHSFDTKLEEGNNVVLAFLSKSFHESVKTKTAYYFNNFYVGNDKSDFDMNAQHLFYSRPKGEYKAEKAKQLLFDFYLINTELSPSGNKVKLTIDETEFMIPEWKAYFVEGLSVGEHSFRIQLVDKDGNMIEGPFNDSGERKITITGNEA